MGKDAVVVEMLPELLTMRVGNNPPVTMVLGRYDVADGHLLQPIVFARKLKELYAFPATAKPHVRAVCPWLSQKRDGERELVTLQIALIVSSLGWIIDGITDGQQDAQKTGKSIQIKNYLQPFMPPVYHRAGRWLFLIGVIIVAVIAGMWQLGAMLTTKLEVLTAFSGKKMEEVRLLEQRYKDEEPLYQQRLVDDARSKKVCRAHAHNDVLTTFMGDIVANIPKDCWLEQLEIVSQSAKSNMKASSVGPVKKIAPEKKQQLFTLQGNALNEKSIAVFFSALLACPSVLQAELASAQQGQVHRSKRSGRKLGTGAFTVKGALSL